MSSLKSLINNFMDFTAFSHGQIQSKVWLCKELEPHLPANARVAILGSWYNVLAFMLLARNSDQYQEILGIDIDEDAVMVSDHITDAWRIGTDAKVINVVADAGTYDLSSYQVVINCSPEHMKSNDWFDNLAIGTLVCIQSSDVTIKDDSIWKCVNPNQSLEELTKKYPLAPSYFSETKEINYGDWGYKRFMIIGTKE